jgi:putative membrane protein
MDWTFPFDGLGGGFGIFFAISAVLSIAVTVGLIVLLALGIRWLIRNSEARTGGPGRSPTADDTALAVLRERFARGEIDATEFEERKRTLGG